MNFDTEQLMTYFEISPKPRLQSSSRVQRKSRTNSQDRSECLRWIQNNRDKAKTWWNHNLFCV